MAIVGEGFPTNLGLRRAGAAVALGLAVMGGTSACSDADPGGTYELATQLQDEINAIPDDGCAQVVDDRLNASGELKLSDHPEECGTVTIAEAAAIESTHAKWRDSLEEGSNEGLALGFGVGVGIIASITAVWATKSIRRS